MGTCYGLCIRLFSLLATAVALLLFQFGLDDRHKGSYSKVDVAVTYVLSVWAAAVPGDDIAVEGRVVELDNIWVGASISISRGFLGNRLL